MDSAEDLWRGRLWVERRCPRPDEAWYRSNRSCSTRRSPHQHEIATRARGPPECSHSEAPAHDGHEGRTVAVAVVWNASRAVAGHHEQHGQARARQPTGPSLPPPRTTSGSGREATGRRHNMAHVPRRTRARDNGRMMPPPGIPIMSAKPGKTLAKLHDPAPWARETVLGRPTTAPRRVADGKSRGP